ncbi:glucose-6-phosphate 1-epimerase [Spizellomyces punctatus DAOM BR117]|uniref:Glucose-6-phosphate 1-epimerase n=1 Tax=Spizellomyces punctatus (strain DAOM BR117) TaxID=645134 RepID=A0A0L0HUZ0_SPIPD|nr:glucose-6-phosphate 1-epimerase [Spizellomyces punctatus DAOM BR117]KND04684.1 hypothetical protein SPPG_00397 [Spizellomyces punctatus DAOM BR117]|eukprot:XP_016612723.1 hypothetical protein SPPG_00397 [Spizellomyces punctatus DAOM BR117]
MPVDTTHPDKVVVKHGDSTAEIYYYGATLTSWKPNGLERIFVSKQAILNGTKAIRGGIPLVFPHFGTIPTSKLPQHGFARNSRWDWVGITTDNASETTVELALKPDNVPANLRELWPHDFRLTYTVTLTSNTLRTGLAIKNPSSTSWDFTTLLHTYFKVQEIATAAVVGLNGYPYVDKVANGAQAQETRERVTIAGEVDRVYEGVKNDAITLQGTAIGAGIVLHKSNFPDVVVWNPWVDKAKSMADFGDEEYHNMICVEVGSVAAMIKLGPGDTWEGSQTLVAV